MKRNKIEAIKKLIDARLERNSLDALELSWFGGEPLLARDVVFELSEFAHQRFEAGRLKGLHGDTTTNGYLLDLPTLRRLVAARQSSFQISLDGYAEGHDRTRRYASGKGTFDRIWKNLLAARGSDIPFKIMLRLHQNAENGESMDRLIDEIAARFGGDRRFSAFFKTIENLGGPKSGAIQVMNKETAKERVARLQKVLSDAGLATSAVLEGPESNTGKPSVAERKPGGAAVAEADGAKKEQGAAPSKKFDGHICYAAKPNSLMIRADGTIGKCTVMLNDERNRIGKLNDDGTVTLDNEKISVWMRGFHALDVLELGCPAQNLPKLDVKPQEAPIKFHQLRAAAVA